MSPHRLEEQNASFKLHIENPKGVFSIFKFSYQDNSWQCKYYYMVHMSHLLSEATTSFLTCVFVQVWNVSGLWLPKHTQALFTSCKWLLFIYHLCWCEHNNSSSQSLHLFSIWSRLLFTMLKMLYNSSLHNSLPDQVQFCLLFIASVQPFWTYSWSPYSLN